MSFRSPIAGRFAVPAAILAAALTPAAAAAAPSATSAKVAAAKAAYHRADSAVVHAAKVVARCQGSHRIAPRRCAPQQRRLQSAGLKLSAAQRRLPRAAASARAAATSTARLKAPTLSVSGTKLSWSKVADVTTYVLVAKTAGKADQYSVVRGTSTTPPAVDGATVAYNVRTAVTGSAWSKTVSITYTDLAAARRAAPVMQVDGQTIRWNQVADVTRYVFVTKAPGAEDKYEYVTGTSYTPPAHPGQTVRYGLSTDAQGAAWATEVSITYPASTTTTTTTSTTPAPSTTTTTSPAPPTAGDTTSTTTTTTAKRDFQFGIVSGSAIQWQLGFIQPLGAKHVRMEFDITTSVATMTPIIAAYAKAGIQPLLLAGFSGRTPTSAEAQNLATWAKAFGPNGTARGADWAPNTAVTEIEFGNESNQPWQYASLRTDPNWPTSSTYATIATEYATKFKEAATAVASVNPGVGLLAIADTPGRWATWLDGVFKAVPNFGSYVKGWVVHPYGPGWQLDIDDAMAKAAAHGASNAIPIFVTEFGFATDNGNCLSDNYGWDRCMTYGTAASTLKTAVGSMRSLYGNRLAALYLYSTSDLSAPGASTDRESYFGALRSDRSSKGAYTTEVMSELAASA
jgi:hypothetical protein